MWCVVVEWLQCQLPLSLRDKEIEREKRGIELDNTSHWAIQSSVAFLVLPLILWIFLVVDESVQEPILLQMFWDPLLEPTNSPKIFGNHSSTNFSFGHSSGFSELYKIKKTKTQLGQDPVCSYSKTCKLGYWLPWKYLQFKYFESYLLIRRIPQLLMPTHQICW